MANMLYNGVELPDIESVWTDKATYPYAVIVSVEGTYMVMFTDGVVYGTDTATVPFYGTNVAAYAVLENAWTFYASGTVSASTPFDVNGPAIWCNNDILNTDGTIYLAASDPVPVSTFTPADFLRWFSLGQSVRRGGRKEEQWETLFEGTVETERDWTVVSGTDQVYRNGCVYDIPSRASAFITAGDTVRITVDGITVVYAVYEDADSSDGYVEYAGNLWLYGLQNADEYQDTGEDYFLRHFGPVVNTGDFFLKFYSRNPGTYTIKIERKVS